MTTIYSYTTEQCDQEMRELEEKWDYQESIGYGIDSIDIKRYNALLKQKQRIEWAKDKEHQPSDNTLFSWAKTINSSSKRYYLPQCPHPNYPDLKILDTKQMRKDYWNYYTE